MGIGLGSYGFNIFDGMSSQFLENIPQLSLMELECCCLPYRIQKLTISFNLLCEVLCILMGEKLSGVFHC